MAESVTLTTPIAGQAAIPVLRPSFIGLDAAGRRVTIQLRPWDGTQFIIENRFLEFTYNDGTTPTGMSLITTLNKANLSTISLEKRTMNQLISSGYISGTVSGTPD